MARNCSFPRNKVVAKTASRLGRGLGSLIAGGAGGPGASDAPVPDSDRTKPSPVSRESNGNGRPAPQAEERAEKLVEIALGELVPNPHQPRKTVDPEAIRELADSIKSEGLLQPVVVRRSGDSFELIAGERRWRAHELLGRKTILARVLSASELSSASLSLIENLQREGLNPLEEAMGCQSLVQDFGLTQAKVAERLGKSRVYVTNLIRLLQLDDELKGLLASGKLSMGHAKALLGLPDVATRLNLGKRAVREQWTVRQCEKAVDEVRNPGRAGITVRTAGPNGDMYLSLAEAAEASLGRRVSIKSGPSGKGRITLAFENQEDLEKILSALEA